MVKVVDVTHTHVHHALKSQVPYTRGGHCMGDCTPTRDRGQSEVKRSRRNFEAGQAVKLGIGGSLRTVKVSPGDRWAWLMLDSQGSKPDFRCGQEVKHENLLGQDLDRGRGWKYRRLCSVPPLIYMHMGCYFNALHHRLAWPWPQRQKLG